MTRRTEALLLAGIVALAALLRLVGIATVPLDADEAMHLHPFSFQDLLAFDLEINPPLFRVLAWLACQADRSAFWIRLPSFLAGTATVAVLHLAVRGGLGARVGLAAAAMLAVHPWHIRHSQSARSFALLALLTLAVYALCHCRLRKADWPRQAALAACQVLSVLTQYLALVFVPIQAASCGMRHGWRRGLALLPVPALAGSLFVPFVVAGIRAKAAAGLAVPYTWGAAYLARVAEAVCGAGGLAFLACAALVFVGVLHKESRAFARHGLGLVAAVFLVGSVVPVEVRYCLPALPFLVAGMARAAVAVWDRAAARGAWSRACAAALLACGLSGWVLQGSVYLASGGHPMLAEVLGDLERADDTVQRAGAAIAAAQQDPPVGVLIVGPGPEHFRMAAEILGPGVYPDDATLADHSGYSVITASGLVVAGATSAETVPAAAAAIQKAGAAFHLVDPGGLVGAAGPCGCVGPGPSCIGRCRSPR